LSKQLGIHPNQVYINFRLDCIWNQGAKTLVKLHKTSELFDTFLLYTVGIKVDGGVHRNSEVFRGLSQHFRCKRAEYAYPLSKYSRSYNTVEAPRVGNTPVGMLLSTGSITTSL